MRQFSSILVRTLGAAALTVLPAAFAAAHVAVGGTGASLAYLEAASAQFSAETGIAVTVVPGLGSSGANRAVAQGALDVSISGRPLKDEETAAGLVGAPVFATAFGLFTSSDAAIDVASEDIWQLYGSAGMPNPYFGGEVVRIVLRPESDSDQAYAKEAFENFADAYEAVRATPGVPVAMTDQDNADLAESMENSLTTGTLLQMISEERTLRPIAIDGVLPSPAAVADGSYPYFKVFHAVHGADPSEDARAFVAFIRSEAGAALAEELGAALVD